MSRCFPFRAPICEKGELSAIGSIELQNGRGNTKQKKEQGLYMKEKPNKKRSRDEHDKLDSWQHKSKRRRDDKKRSMFTESRDDERKYDSEHLERSDLSEEHNPPSFLLNQCSSLQSKTKSSQKNGVQNPDPSKKKPGMILRLKLTLKKPEDQEPVTSRVGPCSTSQVLSTSRIQTVFSDSAHRPHETSSLKQPFSVNDEPCFSGRVAEEPIQLQDGIVEVDHSKYRRKSRSHGHHTPKPEQHFRELMLNWKPPSLHLAETEEEEDLDWLLVSRRQPKDGKSSAQISKPSACSIPTNSLQPRACYLPEYGMYQLPYVIPF